MSLISKFACGVAHDALLIGVEVPGESARVAAGLTGVTDSGPKPSDLGAADWGPCRIIEGDDTSPNGPWNVS